jgi:hypothetical protein
MRSNDHDHIGYRNPPKHGQFRKGQSGNPKGRPKGRLNVATVVEQALTRKMTFTTSDGERKRMAVFEAIVQRLIIDALKGRPRAAEIVLRLPQNFNIPIEPPPRKITFERRIVDPDGKVLESSSETKEVTNYGPVRKK